MPITGRVVFQSFGKFYNWRPSVTASEGTAITLATIGFAPLQVRVWNTISGVNVRCGWINSVLTVTASATVGKLVAGSSIPNDFTDVPIYFDTSNSASYSFTVFNTHATTSLTAGQIEVEFWA